MLAENLKKEREKKKLTQEQVAEQLGVSRVAYTYYETGLKVPTLAIAIQLAKIFDTTIDELVK